MKLDEAIAILLTHANDRDHIHASFQSRVDEAIKMVEDRAHEALTRLPGEVETSAS